MAMSSPFLAHAEEWQYKFNGFVETDYSFDTKHSFLETAGNFPIQGPDTPSGDGGRREFSFRHSRVGFTVLPPGQETWKPKAYVEFDLLGNRSERPLFGSKNTSYADPSLRIRHLYFSVEHDSWKLLTGQTWTLFGWVPTYVLTTVSVTPGPGIIYQRNQQFTAIKQFEAGEHGKLESGLSFAHASQKAGGVPNIDAAVKYSYLNLKSGFASPTGDVKNEPLSFALSGTLRKFGIGSRQSLSDNMKKKNASAFAVDTLVPIIPASGDESSNTLTFTGEFSAGTGYGDAFPGWSGNLPQYPYNSASEETDLSKGQGGFDSSGDFHLFQLQSWNVQLQYHLPGTYKIFSTAGHSQLSASNMAGLGPVPPGLVAYDKVAMDFVNLFHDFSSQVRGAVEYAKFTTHYVNGVSLESERYQISGYFRF